VIGSSGKEERLKAQLALELKKLKNANTPEAAAAIKERIRKLKEHGTKPKIGELKKNPKIGRALNKPKFVKAPKPTPEEPNILDPEKGLFSDWWKKKKKKDVDYWDAGANSGEGWDTTDDTDYSSVGYWESGGDQGEGWDTTISSRRGGSIKKAKRKTIKRKKRRAALRGGRKELRGG
tara:strand:+ start:134 stop:667 length:534 start_codon:yes stop_codon:yes gene_type:complete